MLGEVICKPQGVAQRPGGSPGVPPGWWEDSVFIGPELEPGSGLGVSHPLFQSGFLLVNRMTYKRTGREL